MHALDVARAWWRPANQINGQARGDPKPRTVLYRCLDAMVQSKSQICKSFVHYFHEPVLTVSISTISRDLFIDTNADLIKLSFFAQSRARTTTHHGIALFELVKSNAHFFDLLLSDMRNGMAKCKRIGRARYRDGVPGPRYW